MPLPGDTRRHWSWTTVEPNGDLPWSLPISQPRAQHIDDRGDAEGCGDYDREIWQGLEKWQGRPQ